MCAENIKRNPVYDIPVEALPYFLSDPEEAARDLLGLPSAAISPFFRNMAAIAAAEKGYPNPIDWNTYVFDDSFHAKTNDPCFMHVDLSINRDAAGASMCHISERTERTIRAKEGGTSTVSLPVAHFDFVARLKPRPEFGEREIDYDALLHLFMEVERRGFNLKRGLITFDRFQSHYLMSTLQKEGFLCGLLSVDHTTSKVVIDWSNPPHFVSRVSCPREPAACYVAGRDSLYQGRLELPVLPRWMDGTTSWFEREAIGTMWDKEKQKAHKAEGESDDLLQSILGANFNAINNSETIVLSKSQMAIQEDDWYDDLQSGNAVLGMPGRDDIVGSNDMIDEDLGYVPDDRDPQFNALQDRFNELTGGW
jgi:hypothetical protein